MKKPEFDCEKFAKYMASFDTGNPSEEEALNSARLARRMCVAIGCRVVDVLGRTDVQRALDERLKPERETTPELQAAKEEIADLKDCIDQLQHELNESQRGSEQANELQAAHAEIAALKACIERLQRDRKASKRTLPSDPVNGYLIAAVAVPSAVLLVLSIWR
jgi:septal ring factor EnvC (AmiA/AmiB activator)